MPIEQSVALHDAARDPKRLVVIEGADHNDDVLAFGTKVVQAVVEMLRIG